MIFLGRDQTDAQRLRVSSSNVLYSRSRNRSVQDPLVEGNKANMANFGCAIHGTSK